MKGFLIISFFIVFFTACFTPADIFVELPDVEAVDHIDNFYATQIFVDDITDEVWFSPEKECMTVKTENEVKFSGDAAIHVVWDKIGGGCDWLGLGFGWDQWGGKNLARIYDKAAVQLKVKAAQGEVKQLPLAVCMEDYGDKQAWAGVSGDMLEKPKEGEEWATLTIPLLAFDWNTNSPDITNIKQFMIQFEASGDLYFDDIKIVPHKGFARKRGQIVLFDTEFEAINNMFLSIDYAPTATLENAEVFMAMDDTHFYVEAHIKDETPLQNTKSGDEIWNGDAIEIAFSTRSDSDPQRKRYLSTDHQIGLKASTEPIVWSWKKHAEVNDASATTELTKDGYVLRSMIPLRSLGFSAVNMDEIYGLEIAIDQGTEGSRDQQLRWNKPAAEGFNSNPSLWGEGIIGKEAKK